MDATGAKAKDEAARLTQKYGVPVIPVNCLELQMEDIRTIMQDLLFEFPIRDIAFDLPRWVVGLARDHWLRRAVFDTIRESAVSFSRIERCARLAIRSADANIFRGARLIELSLAAAARILL